MDLKFKDIVKITKVGTTKDPMYKTAIKGEWKSGEVNKDKWTFYDIYCSTDKRNCRWMCYLYR